MIRSFLSALLCSFFLSLPVSAAEDFFTSDSYWNGKKAYDKGDFASAMTHWKAAAERGLGEAQYFVGAMYHAGQAGPKDYKLAMEWYMKAALQDIDIAQIGLGGMYADGHGVDKDFITARMWFSLAEINGNERAHQYLKRIDTRMTAEEITKAEKMAVDWLNTHKVKK